MSVESLVADIQQRFGYQTLRRAAELVSIRETLSTGITAADELLEGGLLCGAAHGISGQPTSGATSLLYAAVASAQGQALPVVYLDMGGLFDPPNAALAGIEIERLLLLSRTSLKHALFLVRALALQQLPCLVAIDQPPTLPLAQLKAVLRDAPLTLLALSPGALPQMQVALACQRRAWQMERGDVIGFSSELRLTAHPFLPFRQCELAFAIPREEACSARW
ncbi:MAG: hypothetical protein OXG49_05340 [Chloroflexi bacterium]|nr:hypothetical protein [Chloroflexota bacterium]